jgi:hypothetical protein
MSALAAADQRRLEQLLALAVSSEFDGEALNALRAAARITDSVGLTLLEALRSTAVMQLDLQRITTLEEAAYQRGYRIGIADGAKRDAPKSWPAFADLLLQDYSRLLTGWEREFLTDFRSRGWARPTQKQQVIFERVAARCGVATP